MAFRHTQIPALRDAPHNAISHTLRPTISHTISVSGERFPGGELVGLHRFPRASGTGSTEGVTDRNARPSRTCVREGRAYWRNGWWDVLSARCGAPGPSCELGRRQGG